MEGTDKDAISLNLEIMGYLCHGFGTKRVGDVLEVNGKLREHPSLLEAGEQVADLLDLSARLFRIFLRAVHKRNILADLVFVNIVQRLEDPCRILDKRHKPPLNRVGKVSLHPAV